MVEKNERIVLEELLEPVSPASPISGTLKMETFDAEPDRQRRTEQLHMPRPAKPTARSISEEVACDRGDTRDLQQSSLPSCRCNDD